jgi:hypothetical protein
MSNIGGTDGAVGIVLPAPTRPAFVAEFISAVKAHQREAVHSMLVGQAGEIVAYIEKLERDRV